MRFLVPAHIVANLLWIGSIVSVGLLLAKGPGDAKARGAAGRLVYRTLAVPAFALSFLFGLVQLAQDTTFYLKTTHFMHAKLTLAFVVIALHHVIGARARKMEDGSVADAGPAWVLSLLLLAASAGAAVVAVLKPF